ncbi:glycoside hydrolase family 6 protein [Paenibacillus sp. JX-17]|uniref:Glucanase n=1 Tax=Paenibacillus lacisoli TaxID=3064525 RepID=A0ABT9CHV6_9BACL|nr:glycoside hydrolase family 6 protein [Paenibacillus sp. JX-17]MDO7908835.1 glycoside hydrolase family 6 protein [Paenibacillus sp. JX-17]
MRGLKGLKKPAKYMLALSLVLGGLLPSFADNIHAESHVDNPYLGATGYINPDYAANVDSSMAKVSDASLKAKMATIKSYPTAVWLDRIAAIDGGGGRLSLEQHLDAALAQKKGSTPITAEFIIYDLPGRDCHALASNGELPLTQAALEQYKTQYIDRIASIFAKPKYQDLRIVAIIEPDSLPNLVTNLSTPSCAQANSSGIYVSGIQYALNKLHAIPNVYNYLDIGHSGWLGWDNNRSGTVSLYTKTVSGTSAGLKSVDGFITNTSNTTPLIEPNLPNPDLNVGGQPIKSSKYYEWNPYFDEMDFTQALYRDFTAAGWPASIGLLIDTSRNGWGGPDRPATAVGGDINTYVNSGRVDRRNHRGNWCNSAGAGLGTPPQAAPAAHLDAYVWAKPPGESDGSSSLIPNDEGKGFDRMCDPTYVTADGVLTGALPNAPISGQWFHDQFVMLVQNAYPAVPGSGGSTPDPQPTVPAAPVNVAAAAGSGQIKVSWSSVNDATAYNVKRSTSLTGPFITVAKGVTNTNYTNTGLTNGTAYYYVVTAVNLAGESVNSAVVTATPTASVTVPAAPAGLNGTAGDAQVKLDWNAVSGASGYTVKRARSASGPYTALAANISGLTYTDTTVTNGTTYYYVVSAVNSAGESANSAAVSAKPQGATAQPPAGSLSVLYRAGDSSATDNAIKPFLNIKNNGSTAVNLSDLKIRYYFTKDGNQPLTSFVDWAQVGGANVTRTFTDTYLEVGFTSGAGTLEPGGQTGDIQLRIHKNDWSNFNEADDYSYDPSKTSYAEWNRVTLDQGGVRVWGMEP